jgi:multidrug efflux pump subunit AcrA (membrane-fusion protein)
MIAPKQCQGGTAQPGQKDCKLINKEAAALLTKYAAEIEKRAIVGDVKADEVTPLTHRSHSDAWRLLSGLVDVMQHVKESDLYWLMASRDTNSPKEAVRLTRIAEQEDQGFFISRDMLNERFAEIQAKELADPDASIEHAEQQARSAEMDARAAADAATKKAHAAALRAAKKAAATV